MSHITSQKCPVCDMIVEPGVDTVSEYQRMKFHFCSQQCYLTFSWRPHLYALAHERKQVIKRRNMRLDHVLDEAQQAQLMINLLELMGVKNIILKDDQLYIEYDLMQITVLRIEKMLTEFGWNLHPGVMHKVQRAWIRYREERQLENLITSSTACCNRPDSGD